jgi:hypothetical protein
MLNAVEKRPALLPVIRVASHRDPFVRLELSKFERARADRMLPHLCRRHVARIDHGIAGSEEGYERRLRPFQMEGRGEISVSGDRFDVLVPSFPRVDAQLLLRLAEKKIPGALDVLSRKVRLLYSNDRRPLAPSASLWAHRAFPELKADRPYRPGGVGSRRTERLRAADREPVQDRRSWAARRPLADRYEPT